MKRLFSALISITGRFNKEVLPEGFNFHNNGSHGFYYVNDTIQNSIPLALRMDCYEEDCDWAIPVFFNRNLFTRQTQERAITILSNYYWKEFEKVIGFTLMPAESPLKAKQAEHGQNIGREYVGEAYGDWCFDVPKSYVYIESRIASPKTGGGWLACDPEGKGYLIPVDIYNSLVLPTEGYKWIDEKFTPYERNKQYLTWDKYITSTGQNRYK